MGLLDDFLTEKMLEVLNSPDAGGLGGLVDRLHSKKLVGVISSWLGRGKKIPITAEQIRQVFGPELIQKFATALGTSVEETPTLLAVLLPFVVNRLKCDESSASKGLPAGTVKQSASADTPHCCDDVYVA